LTHEQTSVPFTRPHIPFAASQKAVALQAEEAKSKELNCCYFSNKTRYITFTEIEYFMTRVTLYNLLGLKATASAFF